MRIEYIFFKPEKKKKERNGGIWMCLERTDE
jgi:hypothetical protein